MWGTDEFLASGKPKNLEMKDIKQLLNNGERVRRLTKIASVV